MTNHIVEEIRMGRNYVRKDDPIKVSFEGHNSVLVKFKGAEVDEDGNVVHVLYFGPRPGFSPCWAERYCELNQVRRVAKTRHGQERELAR